MTEAELIQEIKDDLSASCSLPYNLNDQEITRIINRAKAWMYELSECGRAEILCSRIYSFY